MVALYYDHVLDPLGKKTFGPLKYLASDTMYTAKNVVSMSLYGSNSRYTVGAIRNAMLVKTNFPGWTLRFYLENPFLNNSRHELVPIRIIHSLVGLESEIYYVNEEERMFPPMTWRLVKPYFRYICFKLPRHY